MWQFLRSVAVEQTILLSMVSLVISDHGSFNLIFQKSCDSNQSGPVFLGKHCPTEENAQKETAQLTMYKAMINAACVCLVLMYAGAWSDSRGKRRKPLVIVPILGQMLTDVLNGLMTYFWSTPNYWVALVIGFIPGITGGRLLLMTGSVCYISDKTSLKTRTFRLGVLASLYYLATPLGAALSGKLMVYYGFMVTFALCLLINTLALLTATLLIPDTSVDYDHRRLNSFVQQVVDNFKVLVKKRQNYSRLIVVLCVITSPLVRSPMIGEYSVLYLFVRYKFGWNEVDYGYYAAFKLIGIFFGTMFSMGILSKTCGVSDTTIGILASISDMAAATFYLFATTSWQMFVVPLLDIFHGSAHVVCTSIISKHVDPSELGKVASVKAFLDSLTPFLVTPLYNRVYIYTFRTLPSAFFIISVVFGLPILIIFLFIRKSEQKGKQEETNNNCREIYNNFNNNDVKNQQEPHSVKYESDKVTTIS